MKVIFEAKDLVKEFKRLMKSYNEFYWSTAWAGIDSLVYKDLILNKHKIKKIVVGIHFFQTHPDFILEFLDNNKVKYVKQPNGTFHPKIYLFFNNTHNWEILIGSANFTKQAFSINTEAVMIMNNDDRNSQDVFKNTKLAIDQSWSKANIFNQTELENYKKIWKNQKFKIDSLSGNYNAASKNSNSKSIHTIDINVKSWVDFVNEVYNDKIHDFKDRLNVIKL
ncbi:MAG: phospholipase D family protein, partial [Candidatus Delongbacteria bacterium]|nr:phospholipase D family protein [Candidatus Delongbacteria bacterium]